MPQIILSGRAKRQRLYSFAVGAATAMKVGALRLQRRQLLVCVEADSADRLAY
jgi:hypothetical protein